MKDLRSEAVKQIRQQVLEKISSLRQSLDALTDAVLSESKSTAGDKHETGRAMIQIEQEQLSRQLAEAEQQQVLLERALASQATATISNGSLVETNRGYFFLLPVAGKIMAAGKTIMVISAQSPLGAKFIGLGKGDPASVNQVQYTIVDFCND